MLDVGHGVRLVRKGVDQRTIFASPSAYHPVQQVACESVECGNADPAQYLRLPPDAAASHRDAVGRDLRHHTPASEQAL